MQCTKVCNLTGFTVIYSLTSDTPSHLAYTCFYGGFSVDLCRVEDSGPAVTSANVSPATSTRTLSSQFGAPRRATDRSPQPHRVPVYAVATNRCSHNSSGGDRATRSGRRLPVGSAARSAGRCSTLTPTSPTSTSLAAAQAAQLAHNPPATTPLPPLPPAVTRGSQCSRAACRAPDATALAKHSSGGDRLLGLPAAELRQSLRWMARTVAAAPPATTCTCERVCSACRASSRRSPSASRSLYFSCATLGYVQ